MPSRVIVFHQSRSCSHCKEYVPRFKKAIAAYRGRLDIRSIDLDKADKANQDAAVALKIHAVPTTLVLGNNDKVLKRKEGGISNAEIVKLLEFAAKP
jgi:thiol-disulfide isomerase/thioredoxin